MEMGAYLFPNLGASNFTEKNLYDNHQWREVRCVKFQDIS